MIQDGHRSGVFQVIFGASPWATPQVAASASGATLSTAQEGPHRTSQLLALRATTEGEEGRRGRLEDVRR